MKKDEKEFNISDVLSGTLNILGMQIDLAKLLSSPQDIGDQLERLRDRLRQAGGKEVNIGGYFRTQGILGEREYHIGTNTQARAQKRAEGAPQPTQAVEPAVDVFEEAQEIVVIAEVPGVDLQELELGIKGDVLYLSTKPEARRGYRKQIKLDSRVEEESLRATCRNGILEVRLRRKP